MSDNLPPEPYCWVGEPHQRKEIPMNPLDQYPQIRAALYLLQWVVNGILTIAAVVFVSLGTPIDKLPEWYILTLAIAPALWTYLGLTAQRNVPAA